MKPRDTMRKVLFFCFQLIFVTCSIFVAVVRHRTAALFVVWMTITLSECVHSICNSWLSLVIMESSQYAYCCFHIFAVILFRFVFVCSPYLQFLLFCFVCEVFRYYNWCNNLFVNRKRFINNYKQLTQLNWCRMCSTFHGGIGTMCLYLFFFVWTLQWSVRLK